MFYHRPQTLQTTSHQVKPRYYSERRRVLRIPWRRESWCQAESARENCAQRGQALFGAVSRCWMPVPGAVRLLSGERDGAQVVWNRAESGGRIYVRQVFQVSAVVLNDLAKHVICLIFRYNSGGKCFSQVHTKHLTVTIDAFTIHNSLWQGKKVAMPSKRDMTLVIWARASFHQSSTTNQPDNH